jgi:16S rRNA (adenine1518-N6/adenine1519-N6)-dimethyltransferase
MYEPIKKLGQNFLSDPELSHKMVSALEIQNGDVVVEIGPGHGFLTQELSDQITDLHVPVYAVELDRRFAAKLEVMFEGVPNMYIEHADIMQWLPRFTSQRLSQGLVDTSLKILGSLPFYITSPILHQTIKTKPMPVRVVYLIQKEVAQKISAMPPDANYMSTFAQTFYDVSYLGDVQREKFEPVPKVDGGIIALTKKEGEYSLEFINKLEGFLHRAYKNPRKMLNKAFSPAELALENIDASLRPQNISPDQWVRLFMKLNPGVS